MELFMDRIKGLDNSKVGHVINFTLYMHAIFNI